SNIADVELDRLIAGTCADVLNIDANRYLTVRPDSPGTDLQVCNLKLRVAKSVAKREEGRPGDIQILGSVFVLGVGRPSRIHVIVVNRRLSYSPGKSYRQLSARIHIAKEHVGYCITRLRASKPRLQNRRCVFRNQIG